MYSIKVLSSSDFNDLQHLANPNGRQTFLSKWRTARIVVYQHANSKGNNTLAEQDKQSCAAEIRGK